MTGILCYSWGSELSAMKQMSVVSDWIRSILFISQQDEAFDWDINQNEILHQTIKKIAYNNFFRMSLYS